MVFNSFVFFDLETTGLLNVKRPWTWDGGHPDSNYLSSMITVHATEIPKITEIALHAVPRTTFFRGTSQMKNQDYSNTYRCHIPANVFTAQINPEMNDKEWAAYEAKRASKPDIFVHDRADLLLKNTLRTEWPGIKNFLLTLRPPVCLIAHNGIRFDFPVLYRELQRLEMIPGPGEESLFGHQIYFLDSLYAIKYLDRANISDVDHCTNQLNWDYVSKVTEEARVQRELSPTAENEKEASSQGIERIRIDAAPSTSVLNRSPVKHDTTPEKSDDHPSKLLKTENWSPAKRSLLRDFKKVDNHWVVGTGSNGSPTRGYGLKEVYKRIINGSYTAHYASDDAKALMEVCVAFGSEFVKYADSNSIKSL